MKKKNISTTTINKDSKEDEIGLSALFDRVRAEGNDLIEEKLLFNLEYIFTNDTGYNLRNKIAHGLLGDYDLDSCANIYAWWLLLRIVMRSLLGENFGKMIECSEHVTRQI